MHLKQPTRAQRGPRHMNTSIWTPIWFCSEWGLPRRWCYHQRGALLPHHFTLTVSLSKQNITAVYFLLHWPSAFAAQMLSGTLPYGARTFLSSYA